MPAQRSNDVPADAPETVRAGVLARPRAVIEGARDSAERLTRVPQDLVRAQYELTRGLVSSAVVVDVDVNVDVASRQAPPGA